MNNLADEVFSGRTETPITTNLLDETILFLSDVPKHIPRGKNGRPTHLSTVVRWKDRGIRGVRLEAVRLGGRWVTSLQALGRFVANVTATASPTLPPVTAPGTFRQQAGQDERALDRDGFHRPRQRPRRQFPSNS